MKLKIYIIVGLLLKIGSLIFLEHYDDSSPYVALVYAFLLLCLLAARPLKKNNAIY